jgi:hypothetical protein
MTGGKKQKKENFGASQKLKEIKRREGFQHSQLTVLASSWSKKKRFCCPKKRGGLRWKR